MNAPSGATYGAMNAQRARAYGRVARAVRGAHPGELSREQRRTLREAADTLIFADAHDEDVQRALDDAHAVLLAIGDDPWIEQLAADLQDCAPSHFVPPVTSWLGPVPPLFAARPRWWADR